MIFATIGTQAPFDRFVKALDEIACELDEDIVAQTKGGAYEAMHIRTFDFVPPDEFGNIFSQARLIVAHAGMGTIISALKANKPIIVMPRLASLGEHRNDHQMATAMKLNELGYIHVAYDKKQLADLLLTKDLKPLKSIGDTACPSLIKSLCDFIMLTEGGGRKGYICFVGAFVALESSLYFYVKRDVNNKETNIGLLVFFVVPLPLVFLTEAKGFSYSVIDAA